MGASGLILGAGAPALERAAIPWGVDPVRGVVNGDTLNIFAVAVMSPYFSKDNSFLSMDDLGNYRIESITLDYNEYEAYDKLPLNIGKICYGVGSLYSIGLVILIY